MHNSLGSCHKLVMIDWGALITWLLAGVHMYNVEVVCGISYNCLGETINSIEWFYKYNTYINEANL